MNKKVYVVGGGTVTYLRSHLALCAPAYGTTAYSIHDRLTHDNRFDYFDTFLVLTKMAGGGRIETNEDLAQFIAKIKQDKSTKIVFWTPSVVDFEPTIVGIHQDAKDINKYGPRLDSRENSLLPVMLAPAPKLVQTIRNGRKDIFLVAFKMTQGASEQEMFTKGLHLVKEGSCNLVLVNDVTTRKNMIVTPEEAAYHVTTSRDDALTQLVDMTYLRSHLTFTQSTVISGEPVPWNSPEVPDSLRKVVDYCIKGNAYKPFKGSTVGHFAVKLSDTEFLTSIRRTNFNKLNEIGLVRIETDGPDTVLAYGAKPSVGGQSQRIVFKDHPDVDAIVHFHSPLKANPRDTIPVVSQRAYECGSHECGRNTSAGLAKFGNLYAVYLDQHGPNIVFNKNINPAEVIDFINANFDLDKKTGGYTV